MPDQFIGEIKIVGLTFAPRGYAFCDGQLIPIAQNSALFALLGTTYGGDGVTTFALPDFRGRFPIHSGTGEDFTERRWGEKGGAEIKIVEGRPPILGWGSTHEIGKNTVRGAAVDPGPYMPPYLAVRFVIALTGIFPSRN